MIQGRLYLAEDSVMMHSSSKSWVSAGRIVLIDEARNGDSSSASRGEKVAAKLSQEKEELWKEFMILRSLGCSSAAAFVISVTGFLEPDCIHGLDNCGCCNGVFYALALEKGSYDLGQYLREQRLVDEETKHALVRQLLDIVASINNAGFVWNDVKPANFVFVRHENKWKAIDMESVKAVGSPVQGTSCVTIRYAAPEIAQACKQRDIRQLHSDVAMDAWALGMTLLCIFSEQGTNYFDMQNLDRSADIIRHLTSNKCQRFLDRYIEHMISDGLYPVEKQAIRALLRTDMQSRRSAAEILEWLRQGSAPQCTD